ncbi:MAG: type II toxin-antitoxin system RelE family toxin [Blastocatellia bacterium]
MAETHKHRLVYAPGVKAHLKAIDKQHHAQIRQAIEEQLIHKPDRETRNRKPLDDSEFWEGAWELRCGGRNRFRVFYQIDRDASEVLILAIGLKEKNELIIGKERIKL